MEQFKHYINGKFSIGSDHFETLNPANGKPWASFPAATEEESNMAIESAHTALYQGPWADYTATERGKLIYKLGDLISEHASELGDLETRDSGKLLVETRSQSRYVADYYYYYAGLADKIQGEVLPIDKPNMRVFTTREPIGVVVAIVPWNAQLFLAATKIAPALAAGNTVVVKASEQAPAALFKFAELVHKSGFPPGVINIITGFAEPCGRVITSHPKVARVAFTGGTEVARHIVRNTAENFAHLSLELGGKSPIQRSIHSEIISKIKERSKSIIVGNPLDEKTQVGPLATTLQVKRASSVIKQSIKQGARLVFGGNRPEHLKEGWYFEPTLLDCPNQEFDCVKTELFAPVISVIAFDTEEEAVEMANDSDYGLGAGVFTENLARAHRVSQNIHSGIVWVNTYRAISPISPFGGFKQSGGSREAGIDAIHEYTRTKTTWINTSPDPMSNPFVMR